MAVLRVVLSGRLRRARSQECVLKIESFDFDIQLLYPFTEDCCLLRSRNVGVDALDAALTASFAPLSVAVTF